MVGRLVQQQDVGLLQQQFGQLDTHAPSAAEVAGGAAEVAPLEAKSQQGLFHVFLVVGGIDGVELLAQGRHLFDELHVAVALVVGARLQFLVHAVYLGFHLVQVGKGLGGFLEHGASVFRHQVLRQVGHNAVFGHRYLSPCGLPDACKDLQQGAFSGSVLSHEGDAVLFVNHKRNVAK